MSTTVVRIPEDIDGPIKTIAAMQGKTPGDVVADAWREYFEQHREEFAARFDESARLVREGDTDGMAALLNQGNAERAANAAAAVRARRQTRTTPDKQ